MLADPACPFDPDELIGGWEPFEGDYGDGERVLYDKVCRVRKTFHCNTCALPQAVRSWARVRKEAGPEGITTFRWCAECCEAAILLDTDDGDLMCAREEIGEAIRAGKTGEPVEDLIRHAWELYGLALEAKQERDAEVSELVFPQAHDEDELLHEEDC